MLKKTKLISFKITIVIIVIFAVTFTINLRGVAGLTWYGIKDNLGSSPIVVIKGMIEGFEEGLNTNIAFRKQFVNLNGIIAKLFGVDFVEDVNPAYNVFKLNNSLTFSIKEVDVKEEVESLTDFKVFLDELDIPLMYLQAPFKVKSNDKLPYGYIDYSNENSDNLLSGLEKNNINYIDLRVSRDEIPDENQFYRTDHHWTAEYAFKAVEEALLACSSNQITLSQKSKLIEVKGDYRGFLGTQGRRVGASYVGYDNFRLMVPNSHNIYNFSVFYEDDLTIYREGNFVDAIIDNTKLSNSDIYTSRYQSYLGGDYPLVIINNLSIEKGHIVVFSDSFGLPFVSFLSSEIGRVTAIQPRHFKGDIREYLEQLSLNNPIDYVLLLYNPSMIGFLNDFQD